MFTAARGAARAGCVSAVHAEALGEGCGRGEGGVGWVAVSAGRPGLALAGCRPLSPTRGLERQRRWRARLGFRTRSARRDLLWRPGPHSTDLRARDGVAAACQGCFSGHFFNLVFPRLWGLDTFKDEDKTSPCASQPQGAAGGRASAGPAASGKADHPLWSRPARGEGSPQELGRQRLRPGGRGQPGLWSFLRGLLCPSRPTLVFTLTPAAGGPSVLPSPLPTLSGRSSSQTASQ